MTLVHPSSASIVVVLLSKRGTKDRCVRDFSEYMHSHLNLERIILIHFFEELLYFHALRGARLSVESKPSKSACRESWVCVQLSLRCDDRMQAALPTFVG